MVNKVSLEVVNFNNEMRRVTEEVKNIGNADIEFKVKYATRTLRQVTPVDTGEARRGWQSTINRTTFGQEFFSGTIFNEVEHIAVLNQGSSRQAPKYLIEQVLSTIGILTPR
jgi:hypothetical protein